MLSRFFLSILIVPLVCLGGWVRETADWTSIAAMSAGGYIFSKAEPFFNTPLIPGAGDKPYAHEQVPNSWLYAASAATIGLSSLLPNKDGWLNARSYRHLKASLQAVSSSYFLKEFAKDVAGRPRPDYNYRMVHELGVNKARKSWPSGHAVHAFNLASYLSLYTWDEWRSREPLAVCAKTGITALLFGTATWVAYTRVADNRHYAGDVIAGAVLGAGCALFFYSYQQWWGTPEDAAAPEDIGLTKQTVNFQVTPLSVGVRVSF